MNDHPDFPATPPNIAGMNVVNTAAIATHEQFLAFVAAGFTETQALCLIAQVIAELTLRQQN